MAVKAGLTLKAVLWFSRGVQFACAIILLGIYSYFLATLASNSLPIAKSTRAVEGIAGSAALYSLLALLFLCCLAGFAVTSALAILLDLTFIGAFIYVAVVNRRGAGACRGYSDTPLGAGDAANLLSGDGDAGLSLPKLCTACRLQSASLGVAIISIFFFSFSIATEFALVRNRRRQNRYNAGFAEDPNTGLARPRGIFTRRNNFNKTAAGYPADQANVLPEHAHPDQLRSSCGTEAVDPAYAKYETGYGHHGNAHHGAHHATSYRSHDGIYDRL